MSEANKVSLPGQSHVELGAAPYLQATPETSQKGPEKQTQVEEPESSARAKHFRVLLVCSAPPAPWRISASHDHAAIGSYNGVRTGKWWECDDNTTLGVLSSKCKEAPFMKAKRIVAICVYYQPRASFPQLCPTVVTRCADNTAIVSLKTNRAITIHRSRICAAFHS